MSAAYIQVHFRLDLNMNPDQTAPKLGPYFLQYWLPKNISIREEQTTKVVTGGLRVKIVKSISKNNRLRMGIKTKKVVCFPPDSNA